MSIVFSGTGMLILDALLALCLGAAFWGQWGILFVPQGRVKRQTFWEGLMAWFLLNVFFAIVGIAHFAVSYDEQMATNFFGDVDHVWYHRLVMAYMLFCWLGSAWVFAVLCAKRWHDLNFSGWLALINALPLLIVGYAWCVFLNSVGPQMNRMFAIKSTTLELWQQLAASTPTNAGGWSSWSIILSCALVVALGAYLGFAQGDAGANPYGKSPA